MQTSAERGSGEASTRRPSDRELIARFLASRDESAFAEIVTRYSRLVMSVALHTLRDPHAAEDAFQATFLVLAKSARRIRNRDSLASWLHGTTFRVSHRLLRSRLRRKEQDLPNVELTAPIWADPERPDEQAALDEELSRLSEGLRGPLVLHYLEGRTVPEIAAELKMSQSAVEGRLKRGKRTLRKRLLKRGVLLSSAVFGAGLTVPAEAGVAAGLVTATVAACLKTAATASLTPIAATTIQQIALQETAAMARIALLKTALVCGGVAGAIGLAGAGANGTLGMAWAQAGQPVSSSEATFNSTAAAEESSAPIQLTSPVVLAAATQADGLTGESVEEPAVANTVGEYARDVLKHRVTVSVTDKPFNQLLEEWSKEHNVPIHVDGRDQKPIADLLKGPVSVSVRGLKLDSILTALLKEMNLQHRVEDDGIHISALRNEPLNTQTLLDALRQKDKAISQLEESLRETQVKFEQLKEELQRRGQGFAPIPGTTQVGVTPGGGVGPRSGSDLWAKSSPAGGAPGAAPNTALAIAANQAEAKDQQIRALEEAVKALQAQVSRTQSENGAATVQPGTTPGAEAAAQPGTAPTIAMSGVPPMTAEVKALKEQVEQMRTIIEAQKAESRRRGLGQSEPGPGAAGGSGRTGAIGQTDREVQKFQPPSVNREQIAQALDHKVDFQFTGQTLEEIMTFLATQENITIRLDTNALGLADVKPNTEINLVISGVSLKSALNLMLEDVGGTRLDYVIEDEVMKITTKAKADATMQTVIYDVSGLDSVDANWVASTLEKTVEPTSWESSGGKGTIVTHDTAVMVTTSRRLHDKTAEIMQMLQQQAKAKKANQ